MGHGPAIRSVGHGTPAFAVSMTMLPITDWCLAEVNRGVCRRWAVDVLQRLLDLRCVPAGRILRTSAERTELASANDHGAALAYRARDDRIGDARQAL